MHIVGERKIKPGKTDQKTDIMIGLFSLSIILIDYFIKLNHIMLHSLYFSKVIKTILETSFLEHL